MAYRDHFTDPVHRTYIVHNVSPYLDGLPMRIGDRFQPPPKVMLPVNFSGPDKSVLNMTYDFSLETTVIEAYAAQQTATIAEERASTDRITDRIASDIQDFTRVECTESDSNSAHDTGFNSGGDDSPPPTTENSSSSSSNTQASNTFGFKPVPGTSENRASPIYNIGSDILQPQHIPAHSEHGVRSDSEPVKNINISDFETVDDPFELLERKTLNDREELASLFPPVAAAAADVTDRSPPLPVKSIVQQSPDISSIGTSVSYRAGSDIVKVDQTGLHHSTSASELTGSSNVKRLPPISAKPTSPNNNTDQSRCRSHPPRAPPGGIQVLPSSGRIIRPPQSSSSNSGRVEAAANHFVSNDWNRFSPLPPSPSAKEERHQSSLPNPYFSLDVGSRLYVDNIASMGFPKDRVARTVDRLGKDERIVLDHLFAINGLTDLGHDCDQVETALRLCNNEPEKAEEFLKILKELVQLGYLEKVACDALVVHENNREKTLDYLSAHLQLKQLGFQDTKIREALLKYDNDRDEALDYLTAQD